MQENQRHFIVNISTDEFHVNPLGHAPRFAQYAKGDCQTDEIERKKYADDFAALVIEGQLPCGHCIGRLATKKHR